MNPLKSILQFITFFIILFFGVEIFLRFLQPHVLQYYRNLKVLHKFHPDYLVSLAENADVYVKHFEGKWEGRFTTNSMGHRGSPDPDNSKPQIACLGDSLVMGFGVGDKDTFCYQLNGLELNGKTHQALNLGVDAYGSMGSLKRLAEFAPKLNLKHVLFFVSPNDYIIPQELRDRGVLPDDETDAIREADPNFKTKFMIQFELTRYFYTLQAAKLSMEQLQIQKAQNTQHLKTELYKAGLFSDSPISVWERLSKGNQYFLDSFYRFPAKKECNKVEDKTKPIESETAICPTPIPPHIQCKESPFTDNEIPPLPEITIRSYNSMIELSKKYGFQLTLVILPMQIEVPYCYAHHKYTEFYIYSLQAKKYFERNKMPVIEIVHLVSELCGNPIVDEKTKQNRSSKIDDYFIPADGHLTVLGNKWASESIKKELVKLVK